MKTRKWEMCCESVPTIDPETGKCQNGCKGESKPAVMHTLTPWTYEAEANGLTFSIWNGDISIAETQTEADAAFIVKAVNCHEELLTALKQLTIRFPLEHKTTLKKCGCLQFEDNDYCRHIYALEAITRAEGK